MQCIIIKGVISYHRFPVLKKQVMIQILVGYQSQYGKLKH